ncbi:MAG: N-acetylneuraminate synthase [Chloroflexi bacterium]|nr:MAG: N-acetylneuraminate synthase [Chloroflexota bacterium]MCE7860323.1 N-acetylneuraminate synthase [Chloroflexi bacterium CFX2]
MNNFLDPKRCFVIGEVAQSHDGSLGMAHAFIDAIAKAGADAVKFQTHIAAAESTAAEPWRVKFSKQDASRYDYWKRMEFTPEGWQGLADHAREKGLLFLSSPFSIEAVELLEKIGMPAWKVASGEIGNKTLLDRMLETGKPILLSTGMSNFKEIDDAIAYIRQRNVEHAVMQCSTAYPCPPEKIGLNLIPELRERYKCAVGLSDHSGTIYPGLAAVMLGIEILEVHVAFSREMFGPDVPASVTTRELSQLVEGVRFIERMRASPVGKDDFAEEVLPLRKLFTKSIVAGMELSKGTILEERHLRLKKPGSGLPGERMNDLIGKTLLRDVKVDEQILEGDFS